MKIISVNNTKPFYVSKIVKNFTLIITITILKKLNKIVRIVIIQIITNFRKK